MIINGNNIEELKKFDDNYFDSIVTDPPYEIGFMGKSWDASGIANNPEMWSECLRVLKPGGYLLSFSATRTYHRMAVAIEDSGFEIRDMIEWVYGSGFPKSLNIGKAVDKLQGNEREQFERPKSEQRPNASQNREGEKVGEFGMMDNKFDTKGTSEWEGWGTALKPAHEPICMARKPLAEKTVAENVLKYGTGGINIDESRVGTSGARFNGRNVDSDIYGKYGTDKPKEVYDYGRFPANLIHDNSEEVRECFPNSKSSDNNDIIYRRSESSSVNTKGMNTIGKSMGERKGFKDEGNSSRFFKSIIYQAKASKKERNKGCEGLEDKLGGSLEGGNDKRNGDKPQLKPTKNNHPTVKPIALMEYLIKMVTPTNGIVLDPFMGSGSTGVACKKNGFDFIGIDLDKDYCEIARARMEGVEETQTKLF